MPFCSYVYKREDLVGKRNADVVESWIGATCECYTHSGSDSYCWNHDPDLSWSYCQHDGCNVKRVDPNFTYCHSHRPKSDLAQSQSIQRAKAEADIERLFTLAKRLHSVSSSLLLQLDTSA